jgi:hypothetical protein
MIELPATAVRFTGNSKGIPESATACTAIVRPRYGVLWAYDYEGEGIQVSGLDPAYVRAMRSAFTSAPGAAASRTGGRWSPTRRGGGASRSTCG